MGLMDKVKTQASQLAEKAQQAGVAGQAKLLELQAKRKADAMLLELGGIFYSQKSGRAAPDAESRTGELMDLLHKHEAEHGPVAVTSASAALAEDSGVVDPSGTVPTSSVPPSSTTASAAPPPPAAAPPPPAASAGPIPQAQYGTGES
jgi:hypothetical protein